MEAVILAAGLGTRLRPHTLTTPKPLLPVQGRPILGWILGALPPEVKRILVVVNYLADQIEHYLHQQRWFAGWQTVRQEVPRGTGDAFRSCCAHLRSDRYLVLNGDDLYGAADLAALAGKEAGLLVHPVDEPKKFGIAFARADGTLERLVEKPNLEGRQMANIGAYVFPRRVFDIELKPSPRGEYEITDYVSQLAMGGVVHAVPATFWLPIGDVEAWRAAEGADLAACNGARGSGLV
jgi:UDP-N-acetylglucosamine diphosphorylase / glucose-1-phosphate thymidylyltransferase / UDP-N-acetylgalactosamine diphosphorylase / glucosamine-1-phosphate N-acetyltransferase / galactosamine-1-phosphate N-acetyltransferase